jgi:hypothetical protein
MIVTSKIIGHHNRYNGKNFEILSELPKCDLKTQSKHMPFEILALRELFDSG